MKLPSHIQCYINTQLELICMELNLKDRVPLDVCITNGLKYYFYTCDSKRLLAEFQFIKMRNKLNLIEKILFNGKAFPAQFEVFLDNEPKMLCMN